MKPPNTGTDNLTIMSDYKSVLSPCLDKLGTTNRNQSEKTGLSENKMNNKIAVCRMETAFLPKAPVAQLDRASVFETEG